MLVEMLLPSYCVVNGKIACNWEMVAGAATTR